VGFEIAIIVFSCPAVGSAVSFTQAPIVIGNVVAVATVVEAVHLLQSKNKDCPILPEVFWTFPTIVM
jgi:hypothetical protein